MTLIDILRYRSLHQPNRIAYNFLGNAETEKVGLTYQQLDQQAQAIAAQLQSIVFPGERVLLLYPPGIDFIVAFFGCLYAESVAVPSYLPQRNQKIFRLQAIVSDAKTRVVLTTASALTNIERYFSQNPELATMRWLVTDSIVSNLDSDWQEPKVSSNTLALLQYTSGSTGAPKGVMISHGNLLHNLALIQKYYEHTSNSRGVIWLPHYHDMGLIGGILQPLFCGFPVTLMSPLAFLQKPFRWLQTISHHKATTSGGPNFAYDLCVKKTKPEQLTDLDLSSWEVAFTGAEPICADTLERFATTFETCGFRKEAFYPCYGMAENTLFVSGGIKTAKPIICKVDRVALSQNQVVTCTGEEDKVRAIVGCGRSFEDQKIVIANPESKTQCRDGEIGEVWVLGRSVAQGYWKKPQQTEETFNAFLADIEETPFLRTGDLGFLLNGELFVTGRLKEVIIIRGQNYYPEDIELTVQKSHLALRHSCGAAFSVKFNSSEQLVIIQEVERNYLRKLDVNKVLVNILEQVATEHGLKIYDTILVKSGSIPKTSSGKVQRFACRANYIAGSLKVVKPYLTKIQQCQTL